jgi:predicted hotdog family 3-hydroxylacyl-ACP dehydratase
MNDAAPRHRGQRAVQHIVEYAPHSGALVLWAHHVDLDDDAARAVSGDERAPLLTDGRCLFYRPAFEALPLPLQAGWVAHAVLHVALRHAQRAAALRARGIEVDARLFNLCADAIVNSALAPLAWLALPPHALRLETVLDSVLGQEAGDEASALAAWDVERLYLALHDRRPASASARRDGSRSGARPGHADGVRAARLRTLGAGQPADLLPADGSAEAPEDEAELTRAWADRLHRAAAGDGAFSIARALLADLPQQRTPWEQLLRTRLARALALRPGVSWSRPSRSYLANQGRAGPGRRLPWEPGRSAARAVPRLVVVVDVSGSVDEALLERFACEVQAIVRRCEAALVLVVGDRQVRRVDVVAAGQAAAAVWSGLAFQGGGGTDFTPLLEEAARHGPDLVLVLTDLDGPARFRPPCPVLWAVPPAHAGAAAPFGRVLVLR